jgi:hypothetical protein
MLASAACSDVAGETKEPTATVPARRPVALA